MERASGYYTNVIDNPIDTLVVLGPTASGKTSLGVHLAREFDGEILSADSRQVYRGLDIGSGKDLDEYSAGGAPVRHHLIDIVDLDREFSVYDFQQACYAAVQDVRARGGLPIIVGGTGLYLDAAISDYAMTAAPENAELRAELAPQSDAELLARLRTLRPKLHNTTDILDRERLIRAIEVATADAAAPAVLSPVESPLVLGMQWDRAVLHQRIETRLRHRLEHGMIEEVEELIARGISKERLRLLGLEYRFVTDFLDGQIRNRNDLRQKLRAAIVNFAKRQETWFRRMERRGTVIHWIPNADKARASAVVAQSLRPAARL